MPKKKAAAAEEDDPVGAALAAAADASERFAQAKSELEHRLADIDAALVEVIRRVYDATPPEYQRTFRVREPGVTDEEMTLPEFVCYAMERPRGTTATFTISVVENLYDDGGDVVDDLEYEDEDEPDAPLVPAKSLPEEQDDDGADEADAGDGGTSSILQDFDPSEFDD